MAAQAGRKASATPEQSAAMLKEFLSDPTNMKTMSKLQTFDNDSLVNGVNQILKESGQDINVSSIDTTALRGGQLKFEGTSGKDGNQQAISGTLSSQKIPNGSNVKTSAGYLSTNNKLKDRPNATFKGDAKSLGHASGHSDLINAQSKEFQDKMAGMRYNSKTDSMDILGEDGAQIGSISKIDGKDTLVEAAPTGDSEAAQLESNAMFGKEYEATIGDNVVNNHDQAAEAKSRIMEANGFTDLNFDKVENGVAHGTATVTDEFGKESKVEVLAKDVGSHGQSKKGTTCSLDDSHYVSVMTRPIQEARVKTAASEGTPDKPKSTPDQKPPKKTKKRK